VPVVGWVLAVGSVSVAPVVGWVLVVGSVSVAPVAGWVSVAEVSGEASLE
jgi:hypothetical protein